ncbi:hypothetical protein B0T21DRAFT_293668 [Apiosordaria backusii]|uniref:Uncharacterized protein n=1 Tax=Apiosordaria backusii TaxID=314023 RepID=A0AA40E8N3_9PEZI|nr:hypothetical protein B0T21DRAFT_293668 [Apiosordaria backusii]
MAPQLRRLLPNKGLSWPEGNKVLRKGRRDQSVVEALARVMPLTKENVRAFLLKMVKFALEMGKWLIDQHNEFGDPEMAAEIDPFRVFQEMHLQFTHEMGVDNEMNYTLFVALFQALMDAREAYRNWWHSVPRTTRRQDDELTDGLDDLYFNVQFLVHNELEVNLWVSHRFRLEEQEEEEAAALDGVADGLQAMEVDPAAPKRPDLEAVRKALEDMDLDETMEDAEAEAEVEMDGMDLEE